MLLIFIFIVIIVGVALVMSIYSLFLPFINSLGEIKMYNIAYYGAVSSLERAMLTLKYR
jgi:hypothetical protein